MTLHDEGHDFSFEPEGALIAESVKIQALLASHDAYVAVAKHTRGASIFTKTEDACDDLVNALLDLRSDLEAYYEKIEAELERREGDRELRAENRDRADYHARVL